MRAHSIVWRRIRALIDCIIPNDTFWISNIRVIPSIALRDAARRSALSGNKSVSMVVNCVLTETPGQAAFLTTRDYRLTV